MMVESSREIEARYRQELIGGIELKVAQLVKGAELHWTAAPTNYTPSQTKWFGVPVELIGTWIDRPHTNLHETLSLTSTPALSVDSYPGRREVVVKEGFLGIGRKTQLEYLPDEPIRREVRLQVVNPTPELDVYWQYVLTLDPDKPPMLRTDIFGDGVEGHFGYLPDEERVATTSDLEAFRRFLTGVTPLAKRQESSQEDGKKRKIKLVTRTSVEAITL